MLPSGLSIGAPTGDLLVSMRFSVAKPRGFVDQLRSAVEMLAQHDGFLDARIGRSLDDASLVQLSVRWTGVGAYRRALSAFDVKVAVVPLLANAIDESTAFEVVHVRNQHESTDFTGSRAADADSVGLGEASAGFVPPA